MKIGNHRVPIFTQNRTFRPKTTFGAKSAFPAKIDISGPKTGFCPKSALLRIWVKNHQFGICFHMVWRKMRKWWFDFKTFRKMRIFWKYSPFLRKVSWIFQNPTKIAFLTRRILLHSSWKVCHTSPHLGAGRFFRQIGQKVLFLAEMRLWGGRVLFLHFSGPSARIAIKPMV